MEACSWPIFSAAVGLTKTGLPSNLNETGRARAVGLMMNVSPQLSPISPFFVFPNTVNMSTDDSNLVPLNPSLSLKFHESVLLLYCLKEVKYQAESVKEPEPDLESDSGKSSRNSFRIFVDKLGQICDSELKGKTVTAFAILQPGQIQYRFASNQRNSDEVEDVKRYLFDLLNLLGATPDNQLNRVSGTILERVLAFNRPTIKQYIRNLTQQEGMDHCTKVCEEEGISDGKTTHEYFGEMFSC